MEISRSRSASFSSCSSSLRRKFSACATRSTAVGTSASTSPAEPSITASASPICARSSSAAWRRWICIFRSSSSPGCGSIASMVSSARCSVSVSSASSRRASIRFFRSLASATHAARASRYSARSDPKPAYSSTASSWRTGSIKRNWSFCPWMVIMPEANSPNTPAATVLPAK